MELIPMTKDDCDTILELLRQQEAIAGTMTARVAYRHAANVVSSYYREAGTDSESYADYPYS